MGKNGINICDDGFGNPQNKKIASVTKYKSSIIAGTHNKDGCEIYGMKLLEEKPEGKSLKKRQN